MGRRLGYKIISIRKAAKVKTWDLVTRSCRGANLAVIPGPGDGSAL